MILVVGATGGVGRQVAEQLSARGERVRALSRNPSSASLHSDIEVVQGDIADAASLDRALDGVTTGFLMLPLGGGVPVDAGIERVARSLKRIVFLSSGLVNGPIDDGNFIAAAHRDAENAIKESGTQWTFLRPGYFARNALRWWAPQLAHGDTVHFPYARATFAAIHEADIAAVAVHALLNPGHEGKAYTLTGPEPLTFADQVRIIGEVLDRPTRLEEVSASDAVAMMAPIPAPIAELIVGSWGRSVTEPPLVSNSVADLLGSPARTFRQWAAENADAFSRADQR